MYRVCVVADTGADVDKRVAEAWARVEAGLSRVLTASLRQLNAPAPVQAIDAVEAALAVPLSQDFRASLGIHNGTDPGPTLPSADPSPVPLDYLYDTNLIIERTQMWRDGYHRLTFSARRTGTIRVGAARPALTRTPTADGGITRTRPGEVRP
jgi:cell wall assembly regulator SMI1